MLTSSVAEIQWRRRGVPWDEPIPVQFACDDKPMFGCRLCILMFGLKHGENDRLFADKTDASVHTCRHAARLRRRGAPSE